MDSYYVNDVAQPTGEHEVHKDGCYYMPSRKTYLGEFSSCHPAVEKAKQIYSNVDGGRCCCPDCHTR